MRSNTKVFMLMLTIAGHVASAGAANGASRISCTNAEGDHQLEIISGVKNWYGQETVRIVEKLQSNNSARVRQKDYSRDSFNTVDAVDVPGMSSGCLNFGAIKINQCKVSKELPENSRKNQYAFFTTEPYKLISFRSDWKGYYLEKPLLLGQISQGTLILVQSQRSSGVDESLVFACSSSK